MTVKVMSGRVIDGLELGLGVGEVEGCENKLGPCQAMTAAAIIMIATIAASSFVLNLLFDWEFIFLIFSLCANQRYAYKNISSAL
jgi:hypothetical protein